jgi:Tol biopolymer transport system component/DNA-binding winged helix-turn-helix (wHTH) protein
MPEAQSQVVFEFEGYRLDPRQRRLLAPDGSTMTPRQKVFDTLLALVERAGEPVTKDELLAAVWPDAVVDENNLNQAISWLRQAFGDDKSNPRYIATLTGRGYQFVAEVHEITSEEPRQEPDAGVPSAGKSSGRRLALAGTGLLAIAALVYAWSQINGTTAANLRLDNASLVTNFSGSHRSPTLSPDGTLMAFASDRSGTSQIWVQGLTNVTAKQLTNGTAPATAPSWSPTSDTILFQRAAPDGTPSIWRVDVLAATAPTLVVKDGALPGFAPDGRTFVFTRSHKEIHVGNLDSGDTWQLEGIPQTPGFAAAMPAINADGDIAFVLADGGPSGNLWLYDAEASNFRQLTRTQTEFTGVFADSPAWLPDGSTIVYSAVVNDLENSQLWLVDTKGGEPVQVTSGVGGYGEPAVSRDGARLAYSYQQPVWRLVRTDPATGEHQTIHESRQGIALPTVSPDGESVLFFAEHVYTVPVDGGDARQLTFGPIGEATLPVWSRSDSSIFYYKGRALHRLDPATGLSELVLDDFHWTKQKWLAVHGDRLAYRLRSFWPGQARSVTHDLDSGEIRELDDTIAATDWTRDGRALLGRRLGAAELLICSAPDFSCKTIEHDGEPIGGARPRWSHDESRIYFRHARPDKPGYAHILVVAREGGEPRRLVEIGPYDPTNMFFAIASDDSIIWNEIDSSASSEIWMAEWSGR